MAAVFAAAWAPLAIFTCIGGILFENEFPIPIGSKVQVHIPTRRKKPLFIIGTVVRVEKFGTNQYDIGVSISFLEMDKAIKDEISTWLKLQRDNPLEEKTDSGR